jgi:transposase
MEAFPVRFRERVVEAYDAGQGTQIELALRFGVSKRWIQKLLCQRRCSESIAPLPWNGGRKPVVRGDKIVRLQEAVAKTPDASLDELRDTCAIEGSTMSICRALRRLQITRKKSR